MPRGTFYILKVIDHAKFKQNLPKAYEQAMQYSRDDEFIVASHTDDTNDILYMLDEDHKIISADDYVFKDSLFRYCLLKNCNKPLSINECINNVYIEELEDGDQLVDREGDVYVVMNNNIHSITISTPVGMKLFLHDSCEISQFCKSIGIYYRDPNDKQYRLHRDGRNH